jgi:hypothetical protein
MKGPGLTGLDLQLWGPLSVTTNVGYENSVLSSSYN